MLYVTYSYHYNLPTNPLTQKPSHQHALFRTCSQPLDERDYLRHEHDHVIIALQGDHYYHPILHPLGLLCLDRPLTHP